MSKQLIKLPDGRVVDANSPEAQQYTRGVQAPDPTSSIANAYVAGKGIDALGDLASSALSAGGGRTGLATDAANEISQSVWNSGADQALGFAAPGGDPGVAAAADPGMLATYGPAAAGIAGAGLLYDLSQNRDRIGTGAGYLEAAGAGAGIGTAIAPGIGTVIGAGVGLLGNALGIGHKSRTKVEEEHRKKLAEAGIIVPNSDVKEWENNAKFQQSRNEADLTGKDILHSASLYDIRGYAEASPEVQEAIANKAIEDQLIREHHGTIDVNHNAAFDEFVTNQLAAKPASSGGERHSDGGSGGGGEESPEQKRRRKKAQVDQIISQPTQGPRYDINLSEIYKNPYL